MLGGNFFSPFCAEEKHIFPFRPNLFISTLTSFLDLFFCSISLWFGSFQLLEKYTLLEGKNTSTHTCTNIQTRNTYLKKNLSFFLKFNQFYEQIRGTFAKWGVSTWLIKKKDYEEAIIQLIALQKKKMTRWLGRKKFLVCELYEK